MLQPRIYGDAAVLGPVAEGLGSLSGVRHVGPVERNAGGKGLVTADLGPEAADEALTRLERLGIPAGDISLVRLETIGPSAVSEPLVVVWADVLSQALR